MRSFSQTAYYRNKRVMIKNITDIDLMSVSALHEDYYGRKILSCLVYPSVDIFARFCPTISHMAQNMIFADFLKLHLRRTLRI